MANYEKGVRPVRDWRKPTTVAIDVIIYAILSVVSAWPHLPRSEGAFWGGRLRKAKSPPGQYSGHSRTQGTCDPAQTPIKTFDICPNQKTGSPVWLPLPTLTARKSLSTCGSSLSVYHSNHVSM